MRRSARKVEIGAPTLRLYLRRSKADEGHQQFSLDVHRDGCRMFAGGELARRGLALSWMERVEYVDDDRAGDDFFGRGELRRLRDEVQRGDVVLCRDQSRLGRDALEVTLAIRDLVRDRRARLFYYANGHEVEFASAIDAAMAFIQGTGHQMELEAIRSRTREALRARVRAGRIAGGRCYGYTLKRQTDQSGRSYTVAVVNPAEAEVVRRIFREYVEGNGLKRIATGLNDDHVAPPSAGRRGTGSWAPGCVREMLRNPRYHGFYRHGRVQRVRRGGKRVAIAAAPEDVLTVDVPEWKIIDDATWSATQEAIAERANGARPSGPATQYALSGIGRCSQCGGAIGVTNTKLSRGVRVRAYGCTWHHNRGSTVCPEALRQPVSVVDDSIIGWILDEVLTPESAARATALLREHIQAEFASAANDANAIEEELSRLKLEQRNLSRAVAGGGDRIPALVGELKRRNDRIQQLENDLRVAKRTPAAITELVARAEAAARKKLDELRTTLQTDRSQARAVLLDLFRDGLEFSPALDNLSRRVWAVSGTAQLGWDKLNCDPTGTFSKVDLEHGLDLVLVGSDAPRSS